MDESIFDKVYNPDVISCLANLSNDEVFTPPEIVNDMLDMLPEELFQSPDTTFLDPACKTGVFLREIAKRLIKGLADVIPDLQQRIDHIFHKQLFGIAITELTSLLSRRSLYCSKYANSRFSVTHFDSSDGNIRFKRTEHTFNKDGKCAYCGASKREYNRSSELETHAYEFIHFVNPEAIFNMKFDVIISNPPYQLKTGGGQAQAMPLYHKFIEQSKKMNPRYIIMITPSRWFAGGIGLENFRQSMLADGHICKIVDYLQSDKCFPGVVIAGGVNYFLWDRCYNGSCEYVVNDNDKISVSYRKLNEFDVFIRSNIGLAIVKKVLGQKEKSIMEIMSPLSPFGLNSYERGHETREQGDYVLYSSEGISYISKSAITKGAEYIKKYKVAISYATSGSAASVDKEGKRKVIAKLLLLNPDEVCTFTYFLAGCFDTKEAAENCLLYLQSKFVRYLLFLSLSSIHISKDKFRFVPLQDFSKQWTDEELYAKYNLSDEEIKFIESMIRPMD